MIDQLSIKSYISNYQLDQIFSKDTLEHIQVITLSAGEYLVYNGDEVNQLYMLVHGKLKIFTALPNGRTMLLRFAYPFSLLGDIELIENETAKVQVELMEDSVFLTLSHRIIQELEMNRPEFLRYLLKQISSKMDANFLSATMNILTSVEQRFASYLLSMSEAETHYPYRKDELGSSKLTEIAEMLGTSYRHLNRVVRKFTDEGLILREKKKIIIIDVDSLKARCAEHRYSK